MSLVVKLRAQEFPTSKPNYYDLYDLIKNGVLRRIFGPKRDGVTGEWRKLHNEELNDRYCSPTVVRKTKSRRMKWVGHVARMGKRRGVYGVWWGNLRERDYWGDPGVDGRIILRWIFRKWDVGYGLD
jgi:hypothetical protein